MTDRLRVAATYLWKHKLDLVLIGAFLLILGEVALRLPFMRKRLEFLIDPELVAVLEPNQRGFVWMANMSFPSETITLNRDGFRGPEPALGSPKVLVFGDSEGLGVGVQDQEVWTARLQSELRKDPALARVEVANACQPGHGPWHHRVYFQRMTERLKPDLAIVRVSMQDRNFGAVSASEVAAQVAGAERRQKLRRITAFLPFLANKLEAQIPSLREAWLPFFLSTTGTTQDHPERRAEAGQSMWTRNGAFWKEIAELSTSQNLRVLYLVHDPFGTQSGEVLETELRKLIAVHANVSVHRLGPKAFGLDGLEGLARDRSYERDLTLRRDPHANARQHSRIGSAVAEFLKNSGLIKALAEKR